MRIDTELAGRGLFPSRQKAKEAILGGKIKVNGRVCSKPSAEISGDDDIEISDDILGYVGRGGLKLEKIIDKARLSLEGRICMDIGASTGGFTDCMLQRGAAFVYAVDVGTGQLAEKLLNDSRVLNMEKTDIRDLFKENIDRSIDFISADLSFISLKRVLPKIYELLSDDGRAAVLIKPQFEAGRRNVGKNGIVKSRKVHKDVLDDIMDFVRTAGFGAEMLDYSPVTGGSGNIEYLAVLNKKGIQGNINTEKTVESAFAALKK